jgi:hypothetical protein
MNEKHRKFYIDKKYYIVCLPGLYLTVYGRSKVGQKRHKDRAGFTVHKLHALIRYKEGSGMVLQCKLHMYSALKTKGFIFFHPPLRLL